MARPARPGREWHSVPMSDIVLLHSAMGLRPAIGEFADLLRAGGHGVHVPDFYEGAVFDDPVEGMNHRGQVGPKELLTRVRAAMEGLPDDTALIGFSLGAAFAQRLASERPRARAVVLLHALSPLRGDWPGQPVQLHRYATDPFVADADRVALQQAVESSGATFEDFVVPGSGHLFTDLDTHDGDRAARDAAAAHILDLLSRTSR